ncbi:SsgA family sporulation/cell division regulator [Streptomyces sp. TR06-5]|uniref:SsgA family sporulation/cell division regulator n=1 Tax=unclassified Streptomyces TaxID=2593676 RepID=UPI00399EFF58
MKIEHDIDVQLVLAPDHSVTVPARLGYRTSDPYAAHVAFHTGSESPVHWTFARDLLVDGVFRPCGRGDVRVWTRQVAGRETMCLALSSPDGDALLEVPMGAVASWLERTLRAVPLGGEAELLELDEGLDALLSAERDS